MSLQGRIYWSTFYDTPIVAVFRPGKPQPVYWYICKSYTAARAHVLEVFGDVFRCVEMSDFRLTEDTFQAGVWRWNRLYKSRNDSQAFGTIHGVKVTNVVFTVEPFPVGTRVLVTGTRFHGFWGKVVERPSDWSTGAIAVLLDKWDEVVKLYKHNLWTEAEVNKRRKK